MKQFFFGTTDSPLHMFQHALGSVFLLIFIFLFLTAVISWIRAKGKRKQPVSKKVITEKKVEAVSEKPEAEKIIVTENILHDSEEPAIYQTEHSRKQIENELQQISSSGGFVVENFSESICNTDEHIFLFTEILLNKRLSEQDWDKRIPETILLDHRSYHQLIFLLVYLNPDTTQTSSRFKMVLETTNEVAINHQIYFRNWMMPENLLAAFKTENNFSPAEKNIRTAIKISEQKNWKLQASTSEQGTMINLLMKLQLPK